LAYIHPLPLPPLREEGEREEDLRGRYLSYWGRKKKKKEDKRVLYGLLLSSRKKGGKRRARDSVIFAARRKEGEEQSSAFGYSEFHRQGEGEKKKMR